MKKLISILLFGILSQTAWAGISKKDCKKACETCMKCSPTPTPPPPVTTLDVKLVSLLPASGTLQKKQVPVAGLAPFLWGSPGFVINSNQNARVRMTATIGQVNPSTHQLISTERTSSAGFPEVLANVDFTNNLPITIPIFNGTNLTYRIKICAYAVDYADPVRPDLPDANLSNNCLTGEYLVID